jgi:DNA replication licensing factor MCM7
MANARRYVDLFSKAVDEVLPEPTKDIMKDVLDVIHAQRKEKNEAVEEAGGSELVFPPRLMRR